MLTKQILIRWLRDEEGQDLVEYALLLAFVVVASIASLTGMRNAVSSLWSKVGSQLAS